MLINNWIDIPRVANVNFLEAINGYLWNQNQRLRLPICPNEKNPLKKAKKANFEDK